MSSAQGRTGHKEGHSGGGGGGGGSLNVSSIWFFTMSPVVNSITTFYSLSEVLAIFNQLIKDS